MNSIPLSRRRNLGIIAHIDAGKTTLTERLLWRAGAIHRTGEVHDGAATTDFSPIERERGITIGAAAVQAQWRDRDDAPHLLTLIDTPGHVDFAIEVERSLRVLDGAVAVFSAVDGVQPQSETVWRQAHRHGVPLLAFVNKMDRPGASFAGVLAQLRERLDARPWPLGLPLGEDGRFDGWVDLVHAEEVRWDEAGQLRRRPWDAEQQARYAPERDALVAAVADHDEALADAWLEGREVTPALLRQALRRATLAGAGVPVLAGSAFRNLGVETLLDAVLDYLPSPLDRPAVSALDATGQLVTLPPDPDGPLAALVFKVAHQDHATLAFVRVYSGTLRRGEGVAASGQAQPRRVGRIAQVQADELRELDRAGAGEIVAVLGWKDVASGQTLSAADAPLRLEAIQAQPPVLAWRLAASNASEQARLGQGLAQLVQEDPSLRLDSDPATAETLLWGMGELHLEVSVERLRREWKLDVRTGTPTVAYQETPRGSLARVEGKVAKQSGGHGQYARVVLALMPRTDAEIGFVDRSTGGVVPRGFVAAIEKGVRAALGEGPHGFPVVGVDVALVDGQAHAVDSSDQAFQRAASEAVRAGLAEVGTQVLEPVMELAVDAPSGHLGDVIGDLQRRQGRVTALAEHGARAALTAQAPLAQLQAYATALRSLTQGRASASLRLHGYAPVRAH